MTDTPRDSGAHPPGRGKQDHETMYAAGTHPMSGPANDDHLAASGGLSVPGHEPHPLKLDRPEPDPEMIPGERDRTTLTHREPGAIGGRYTGDDIPPSSTSQLDESELEDRLLEGGGQEKHR